MSFEAGQAVVWTHTPRGGYGFSYHVAAIVIAVNAKTISIRVVNKSGEDKIIRVKSENLKPKEQA